MIYHIRNLRGELGIPPGKKLRVSVSFEKKQKGKEEKKDSLQNICKKYTDHIMSLARLKEFNFIKDTTLSQEVQEMEDATKGIKQVLNFGTIFLDAEDIIDMKKEKERLKKENQKIEKELTFLSIRMNNQDFIKKAPQEIINKEKERIDFLKNKQKEISNLFLTMGF